MRVVDIELKQIVVEERQKRPLGDIDGLMASIEDRGLLQPIVVGTDRKLKAGWRRLVAFKRLGHDTIPAHLAANLNDVIEALKAERDENTLREALPPTLMVKRARELEELERAEAQKRQGTRTDLQPRAKFAQSETGKTRDKVGNALGISGESWRKAKQIVEAAEDSPETFGDLPELMDEKSIDAAHKELRKRRQAQEREQTEANILKTDGLSGQYRTLVVDPPWPVQKILREERPNQDTFDYPTMTLEEIANLPVPSLAYSQGCHVYLWVTHKFLPDGLVLFERWGVKYQCLMTWVKNVGITPFSWMYDTEHVLFGRIGSLDLLRKGLRLSFSAKVTGHSVKPDIFYERVIQASPEPRLELFARRPRAGFEAWGNEV